MNILLTLTKRNIKLFFKDKGMFLTSLITPAILLVLYATFLGNIYRDTFTSNLPDGIVLSNKLINGLVGGQLISSILAVSCITVSFCSNFLMVQDKVSGSIKDFKISPLNPKLLAISYFISTLISTLIICMLTAIICLIYIALVGWYLTYIDVILLLFDIIILVLFGTTLSSIINCFLNSQGQISAIGTIISSGYGFICGAYMPLSSFSNFLQKILSFLPGTYGTSLVRNHALNSAILQMEKEGVSHEVCNAIKDVFDCNLYFFNNKVSILTMYIVLITTTILFLLIYIIIHKKTLKKG